MVTSLQEKVLWIEEQLEKLYGRPQWKPRLPPLEELILTILTQHTSDKNAWRAYENLRKVYPSWEEVVQAPTKELEEVIRTGGLAQQKASRIQGVLKEIFQREGVYSLERLSRMSLEEGKKYLTSLKGVGPKTAAVVLGFSLGYPVIPVDTHVYRVSLRLGLIPPRTSADKAHDLLEAMVPPEDAYAFHVKMIRHGREICSARHPRCSQCPLLPRCPEGQKRFMELSKRKEAL